MAWLPPAGMRGRMHEFDPRPGGRYQMSLVYESPDRAAPGKTTEDADVVEGRFVELVPSERVVQGVTFDSDDPAFAGVMTMHWILTPAGDGTDVSVRAEDVPVGIRKEDHDAGLRSSLENLAAFVE